MFHVLFKGTSLNLPYISFVFLQISASFRDVALYDIFTLGLTMLKQVKLSVPSTTCYFLHKRAQRMIYLKENG